MSAIRHQHRGGNPAIAESDLLIHLQSDPGTGTFTICFAELGLCSGTDVLVRLGRFGGPLRERVFVLPRGLDLREPHRLVVAFAEWWIVSATLGGQALATR